MIKKTNFFFEISRIIWKSVLFKNILFIYPLQIKKVFLVLSNHFCRIIEIHSIRSVTQQISDSIFVWVIYPFFNSYFGNLLLVLLLFWRVFKNSLRSNSLYILLLQRDILKTTRISLGIGEPVLTFHKYISAVPLNRYIFCQIIVCVQLAIVWSKSNINYN